MQIADRSWGARHRIEPHVRAAQKHPTIVGTTTGQSHVSVSERQLDQPAIRNLFEAPERGHAPLLHTRAGENSASAEVDEEVAGAGKGMAGNGGEEIELGIARWRDLGPIGQAIDERHFASGETRPCMMRSSTRASSSLRPHACR